MNKKKAYVASHDIDKARKVAEVLDNMGFMITSRWLENSFNPTDSYTLNQRIVIATEDVDDVSDSDFLVLISSDDRVPGGKFVEVGVALGQGKSVYILGHRENMLMYHPKCIQLSKIEDINE